MMKLIPVGDYYLWFCEWCDSQNRTLWARMDAHHLTCGVCSRQVAVSSPSAFPASHGATKQVISMPAL